MDKINIGQAPGGRHDGTPLRIAFDMINKNFDYLGSYSGRTSIDIVSGVWYDVAGCTDYSIDIEMSVKTEDDNQSFKISGANYGSGTSLSLIYNNLIGDNIFDNVAITRNGVYYNVSLRASQSATIGVGYFGKYLTNGKPLEISLSHSAPEEILNRIEF